MPEIPPIGQGPMGSVNRTSGASASEAAVRAPDPGDRAGGRAGDRVELSTHARLLDRLLRLPDVRDELVERVRHAIADGTFETPEKLDIAVRRLLEELQDLSR